MKLIKFLIAFILIAESTFLSAMPLKKDTTYVTIGIDKVTKLWDKAEHNAFTDLIRFNNAFYCTFRESSSHVRGTDGKIRILKSTNGDEWTNIALLEKSGLDLRDPKMSITPDGLLMIIMGGSIYSEEGRLLKWLPQVAFFDDLGSTFTNPKEVKIDPALMDDPKLDNQLDWLWRVTWHKGNGYAIDMKYEEINGKRIGVNFLVKTKDGIHYEKVSKLDVCKSLNECAYPNESTIRFDKKDKMYVLVRMARGDRAAVLVTAKPPYKNWVPQKLSMVGYIGGPNFLFLDKKTLILGGRSYDDTDNEEVYTGIKIMDLKGRVKKVFRLPSGGDNSYPGLAIHDGYVWISYYSSHEGKAAIYLTKIPLDQMKI